MQFFGRCRAAYVFITADIRITFDRAGTVDSLVIRDVGITGNRRIVQIRIAGSVQVATNGWEYVTLESYEI